MKFSKDWLLEMIPGYDVPPDTLAHHITLHTAECDGFSPNGTDYVIEIDNKSLTHRPDLWGHHGMAREVAAILGGKLIDPVKETELRGQPPAVRVIVDDHYLCPRYSALVFSNVKVQPSPDWLQ